MFKDLLVKAYKKYIPPIIDSAGIYDHTINKNQHKLVTPMYHRIISSLGDDPLDMRMCVTQQTFYQQLTYYRDNFTSIKLSDYVADTNKHNDANGYVSVTFDDGYKDNILNAIPLLKKLNIHATFFICCSIFTDNKEFWWDTIINAFATCETKVINVSEYKNILRRHEIEVVESNRKQLCLEIMSILWTIKEVQLIHDIAKYIEYELIGEVHKIPKLTESDVKYIHDAGFEIGSHTLSHANLKLLSPVEQREELVASKNILKDITGDEIHGFAYPAGYQNHEIEKLVHESGFNYAVSTINGINHSFNPYSIERFGVPETSLANIKRCIYNYCKA